MTNYISWEDYLYLVPEDKREKYMAGGVYSISAVEKETGKTYLLYIGKSKNMLQRVCSHLKAIECDRKSNKYQVLRDAAGDIRYQVVFDVVAYIEGEEERTAYEGQLIRENEPPLNT